MPRHPLSSPLETLTLLHKAPPICHTQNTDSLDFPKCLSTTPREINLSDKVSGIPLLKCMAFHCIVLYTMETTMSELCFCLWWISLYNLWTKAFALWQKPLRLTSVHVHPVIDWVAGAKNRQWALRTSTWIGNATSFRGNAGAALGPTFCFGLTRANTRMWGKRLCSSRGSQLSLASPSPVTHRSNCCTNEETEEGGSGTCTLPSIDSHCHSPVKQHRDTYRYVTLQSLSVA